jgi:hypothetical protein
MTRSTPTRSTKDRGSHHGLHGARGGLVLLWLGFFSWRWWLLFLGEQAGMAKAQRNGAVVRAGRGRNASSWGKGRGGQ